VVNTAFITAYVTVTRVMEGAARRLSRARDEKGQASAEYALVLLGAALLAIFLGQWVLRNDTMNKVFDDLLKKILGDMPK